MKSHQASLTAIALLFLLLMALPAAAQVPQQINYQGMLVYDTGNPMADGDYEMTFAIYDAASGGTQLWSETQDVAVAGGVYDVVLGQPGNEIDPADMDGERYLGVRVESDAEMTPRQAITATAFSLRSAVSDDADTLDGMDSTAFGDITAVTAGTGLSGGGAAGSVTVAADTAYLQRRVIGSCPAGSSIRAVSSTGSVTCEVDDSAGGDITGVTAGTGLSGGGTAGTVTISASFAGSGSAATIARSDHTHDSRYYTESEVNTLVAGMQSQIDTLQSTVDSLTSLLAGITRAGNEFTFSGVNVRVVNGTGSTAGTGNSLGNLIVGYNENTVSAIRTGSHNLVVGIDHEYTSYAGLLAGRRNRVSGSSASVMGYRNDVTANYSSISGGYDNTVSSIYSAVSGGRGNTVSAAYASISGGRSNLVSGNYSSISGGYNNIASGQHAFVGGGGGPNALDGNIAVAHYSAILGGLNNLTGDGTLSFDVGLNRYAMSGGSDHTIGLQSTMSGGTANMASGDSAGVSGGTANSSIGVNSSISGGFRNEADGSACSVSGGYDNTASDSYASVSGGRSNTASGDGASVSGGFDNTASGPSSSVSGGLGDEVSGPWDWRAGDDFFSED